MPFTSYAETRPWAAAIREAVRSGAMPPWHAAPNPAHHFRNDRALPENEAATLVKWAEAGAPEGGRHCSLQGRAAHEPVETRAA